MSHSNYVARTLLRHVRRSMLRTILMLPHGTNLGQAQTYFWYTFLDTMPQKKNEIWARFLSKNQGSIRLNGTFAPQKRWREWRSILVAQELEQHRVRRASGGQASDGLGTPSA